MTNPWQRPPREPGHGAEPGQPGPQRCSRCHITSGRRGSYGRRTPCRRARGGTGTGTAGPQPQHPDAAQRDLEPREVTPPPSRDHDRQGLLSLSDSEAQPGGQATARVPKSCGLPARWTATRRLLAQIPLIRAPVACRWARQTVESIQREADVMTNHCREAMTSRVNVSCDPHDETLSPARTHGPTSAPPPAVSADHPCRRHAEHHDRLLPPVRTTPPRAAAGPMIRRTGAPRDRSLGGRGACRVPGPPPARLSAPATTNQRPRATSHTRSSAAPQKVRR